MTNLLAVLWHCARIRTTRYANTAASHCFAIADIVRPRNARVADAWINKALDYEESVA